MSEINAVQSPLPQKFKDKLSIVLSYYLDHFDQIFPEEIYKWEAVKWYKDHWNIEAPDFAAMVNESFGKASNLLAGSLYYPYKMLTEYSIADPEAVRSLFRTLYDESLSLEERYTAFRSGFDDFVKPKKLNHYQDLHAITVYLSFEYPSRYFIYKHSIYTAFRDYVGYSEPSTSKGLLRKYENYISLCNILLNEIKDHDEIIQRSQRSLTEACYDDQHLHLLTHDILYCGGRYMSKADWSDRASISSIYYWPSKEDYDPGITVSQWILLLNNPQTTPAASLDILKKMMSLGGESTCAHLAEVYGKTASHYNSLARSYCSRIHKTTTCPLCYDSQDDADRLFPVVFQGRHITEDGKPRYSWRIRDELQEALKAMTPTQTHTDISLNTLLYGPPGTGKTYHTVLYAVSIVEDKPLADILKEEYSDVLKRYQDYKKQGFIEFTTFHQSYGYEEFIEGIKPIPPKDDQEEDPSSIQYNIQPGLFKKFCEKSYAPVSSGTAQFKLNETPTIWKVSLEGTGPNPTRTECLQNGHIRIAWDLYGKDITDATDFTKAGGKIVLNSFINKMKIGDIVFSCFSASTIDAIGIVTGEYEWHPEYSGFRRLRNVHWIATNIQENILEINDGLTMTLSSVYRLNHVSLEDAYRLIEKYTQPTLAPVSPVSKNRVFIIDEINRGNISKIFGELITLIEPSKRKGQPEGMEVRLPYSQKPFGIPDNIYLLGTMNTADRSIANIDTALRRRFEFREVMPDPSVLDSVEVEDLSIRRLLDRMNQKIEVLYDREHTIGHAYFMPLKASPTIETLADIFRRNILPLLQEYFYEDYEKIRLVLGDNQKDSEEIQFVVRIKNDYSALFGTADLDLDESFRYKINSAAFDDLNSYRSI